MEVEGMIQQVLEEAGGKNVLITGGLGMLGSTIAAKLVGHAASVTLYDAFVPASGASRANIEGFADRLQIVEGDIRDKRQVENAVKGQDIVFNLAAQVSHNDSMRDPFLDADINYIGHLNLLEALKEHNPTAIVVHAGTRLQYGRVTTCPVPETHPLCPRTPYGLNKTAAENMYRFYHEMHGIPCVLFRLANPYGPRSQMQHGKYSIVNWFIRQAMDGEDLTIYGEGDQVRDYVYVDDVAEAFIVAALTPECCGEVFNVGSGAGTKFWDMATEVIRQVGAGQVKHVSWPKDYVNVETGDYVLDISKLCHLTRWKPRVGLADGIRSTVEYYLERRGQYW